MLKRMPAVATLSSKFFAPFHTFSIRSAILVSLTLSTSVSVGFAEEVRSIETIVVYGDSSRDWLKLVKQYADLLESNERPKVIKGDPDIPFDEGSVVAWFGDLSNNAEDASELPVPISKAVRSLATELGELPEASSQDEVVLGVNCFIRDIERSVDFPPLSVNFSGSDPQEYCKGLTIARLLLRASQ
jgi:hypothetical protein